MQAARGAPLTSGAADDLPGEAVTEPRRVRRTVALAVVALIVLAADLATKVAVVANLQDGDPIKLFGGLFYLIHTRNTGAAFSLASGFTIALTGIAVSVIVFILYLSRRLYSVGWAVALGMVLGGATGNLIDRIFRSPGPLRGGVVDFISLLDPVSPPFPVFNVADSALVVGVSLAVLLELRGRGIDGVRRLPSGESAEKSDQPASGGTP
jgi:signal peptidase II